MVRSVTNMMWQATSTTKHGIGETINYLSYDLLIKVRESALTQMILNAIVIYGHPIHNRSQFSH
jgi:hypothetical protein